MKTTQTLTMAALLLTVVACSKQEGTETATEAPMAEIPAMT